MSAAELGIVVTGSQGIVTALVHAYVLRSTRSPGGSPVPTSVAPSASAEPPSRGLSEVGQVTH